MSPPLVNGYNFIPKDASSRTRRGPRIVLAIRHGQSVWNVLRAQHSSPTDQYSDVLFHPDCDVTARGVAQGQQAGRVLQDYLDRQVAQQPHPLTVHVVASPLRRALQTAQYALDEIKSQRKEEQSNHPQWHITHQTVHPAAAEVLRDPCDIGTPLDQIQAAFPTWDWSLVAQQCRDKNGYWWGTGQYDVQESWHRMRHDLPGGRESHAAIQDRMQQLRTYIRTHVTADICVVVCHSETIWWLSSQRGTNGKWYGLWTDNGEMVDVTRHILDDDPPTTADDATETESNSSSSSSVPERDDEASDSTGANHGSGLDERYKPFEVFLT